MNKRFLLLTVGILILSYVSVLPQGNPNPIMPYQPPSSIFLGPVVGFNKSLHSVDLKTFAQDPLCPTFIDGSDNGFFFGLSFEYLLGEVQSANSSIIARLLYNSLPASMEQNDLDLPTRIAYIQGNDTIDVIQNTSVVHLNSVKYDLVTFEIMYKFNPLPNNGFGITIGPTFDFALTKTQEQRMDLLKPLNAQFKRPEPDSPEFDKGYVYTNNDRSIIIMEGDIPNSSAFRLGIKAGLQYELLLAKGGMYVVPNISYNFGVTNLSSEFNWRVNALQVGIDLRFSIDTIF